MKSLYFLVFCLLATAICFFHSDFSSSSSTLIPLSSRRSMREWDAPISTARLDGHGEDKVLDEEQRKNWKGAHQLQNAKSEDQEDELIYHIDYNGVMTHPSPTPKDRP
ncbi:hypothetical protein LINGRAHAP2_LOCUS9146 [Linum grandiflorum]